MRVPGHPGTLIRLWRPPGQTPGISSRVYPATSGSWRLSVAYSCIDVTDALPINVTVLARQRPECGGTRRVWDSNPRDRSPGLAVFKTDYARQRPAVPGSPGPVLADESAYARQPPVV